MNVFGEIGHFIIKYQEPIQAAAIIVGVLAVILIIIKMFRHARKKHEILTQINTTVSEINTAVGHLQDRKAEVIYIDSRMTPGTGESGVKEVKIDTLAEADAPEAAQSTECDAVPETPQTEEADCEKIEPSLKYFSRDCAVSKTGKRFTYEELDAQIKA